jgi:hypothetical protein
MGDPIRTPPTTVGSTQSLGDIELKEIQGKDKTQGPGVGTEPPPVSQGPGGTSGAPSNPEPLVDPKTASERLKDLMVSFSSKGGDLDALMQRLEEAQHELGEQQVKTQTEEIKNNKLKIDANVKDMIAKIQDSVTKMEEQKTADTVKKVFSVVAAVIGLVAAVAGVIATGGVGLAAALPIAVAAIGCIVTVLNVTGGMDAMFDAMHASPEVRMGVQIGIAALLLLGGVGCIVQSALSAATQVVNVTAKLVSIGANISMGVTKVGEGISQAVQTQLTLEVAQTEDDKKKIEISNTRIRQQQEELMKAIRDLMKQIEDGVVTTTQIMQSQSQSTQRQIRAMS